MKWILGLISFAALFGQAAVSTEGPHRMELVLERHDTGHWKVVDPRIVLGKNDKVRFKFRTNFDGYLYVTNQSTSGTNTLLYPREDTGTENEIKAGKDYFVPATQGAFRVDGPSGRDVVSWLVSPVMLAHPAATLKENRATEPVSPPRLSLKPRCDDEIFKARGDCLDVEAGAKPQSGQARELVFIREKQTSIISSPVPLKGPVVYAFYLAHH